MWHHTDPQLFRAVNECLLISQRRSICSLIMESVISNTQISAYYSYIQTHSVSAMYGFIRYWLWSIGSLRHIPGRSKLWVRWNSLRLLWFQFSCYRFRQILKKIVDTKKEMGKNLRLSAFAMVEAKYAAGDFVPTVFDAVSQVGFTSSASFCDLNFNLNEGLTSLWAWHVTSDRSNFLEWLNASWRFLEERLSNLM